MSAERIELGDVAKDTVTGLSGVVVGDMKWLHGCRRLTLQPQKMKDNVPVPMSTFDEPQLVLVKKASVKGTNKTGGPRPEPSRVAGAERRP